MVRAVLLIGHHMKALYNSYQLKELVCQLDLSVPSVPKVQQLEMQTENRALCCGGQRHSCRVN